MGSDVMRDEAEVLPGRLPAALGRSFAKGPNLRGGAAIENSHRGDLLELSEEPPSNGLNFLLEVPIGAHWGNRICEIVNGREVA